MAGRLILDSGALIGWQRNDRNVWRYVAQAAQRGTSVVVPAVVIAECVRGGGRDASIHRLLATARVPVVGKRVAVHAGHLLGGVGMSATIDALVASEAIRGGPCVLLTSDPRNLASLVGGRPYVRIVGV
jgi:D-alanine-D-alanine ligase-like ATP-grasp enzyme